MKNKLVLMGLLAMSGLLSAQVPQTGLLASWDFNGNINDGIAGNVGTWQGAGTPNYVKDRCNKKASALHFDGVTNYVEMQFSGPPNADARSISFWMRSDNHVSGGQYVVRGIFNYGYYTQGITGSRWEICHNYGCEGVGVDISHEYFTTKSACVNNGAWHHVVVTQAQSAQLNAARVYIDGILMPAPSVEPVYPSGMPNCSPTSNTGINQTDIIAPDAQFKIITIGSVLGSLLPNMTPGIAGRFYDGDLDDVLLYDRVLNSVEVAQLFAEQCEMRPCVSCDDLTIGGGEGGSGRDFSVLNQTKQIEELRQENAELKNIKVIPIELSDKNVVVLQQNVPNPFAEETIINYNIPTTFNKAQIIFITSEGNVVKAVDILEKGLGQLKVFSNDLSRGIYSYRLVVDGITIESKKMIKQ